MNATAIKIRFVVYDTMTGLEVTNYFKFEEQASAQIPVLEDNDKEAGCYIPNSYRVRRVEMI